MKIKIQKVAIKRLILFFSLLICTFAGGGFTWTGLLFPFAGLLICFCLSDRELPSSAGFLIFLISVLFGAVTLIATEGNIQTGLYECEKIMLFYLAFLTAASEKSDLCIFQSLFAVAFLLSVPGFFGYVGLLKNIPENVFVSISERRLQSLLKYANSTACFLGVGYVAAMKCICAKVTGTIRNLYYLAAAAVLTALYLTFSKGFLPLFILAGSFLMVKNTQVRRIFLSQNLVVFLFVLPIRYFSMRQMTALAVGVTLLCITIAALLPRFAAVTEKKLVFVLWCTVFVLAMTAAAVYAANNPRVFSTLETRLLYYNDTVRFMNENFWFSPRMFVGFGPGSWRLMYYGFQSSPYNVLCLHNGFLQLIFENGLLFTVLFFSVIFRAVYVHFKAGDRFRLTLLSLILVHSLIDLDLSFGCILAVVGFLSGEAYVRNKSDENGKIQYVLKTSVIVFAASIWIYMAAEYGLRQQLENHYLNGENKKAYQVALLLEKLCPRDSSLQTSLAALSQENGEPYNIVKMHLEDAAALSPHNARPVLDLARYTKDRRQFGNYCNQYIAINPMQPSAYADLLDMLQYRFNQGFLSKEEYDEYVAQIRRQMDSDKK